LEHRVGAEVVGDWFFFFLIGLACDERERRKEGTFQCDDGCAGVNRGGLGEWKDVLDPVVAALKVSIGPAVEHGIKREGRTGRRSAGWVGEESDDGVG